jgi:NAD(P)-dependent dehydrogenase (short-subunit alcohol dehydrogenase family)
MNELEGRGAAWTEDRGTSDEERRPLTGAWQASGQQSLLPDRVVLITGGTAGLGAGIARAAAREGALVAVTGRRREPGEALAAELTEAGTKALFVQADVTDVAQARACAAAVITAFGRVDSLVNGAGLTARGTLLDTTPELFDAHIAVNLKAVLASGVDGMLIAAPTSFHAELIELCVAAGLPTFCEKPVARDNDEAARLARRITDTGVQVQIGYPRRFDPTPPRPC